MQEQSIYLDRYQLLRLLGRGGMGEVWLARDLELEAEVALKFLVSSFDEKETEILRRETKQARKLSHPHILSVYDFHTQVDGVAAISMEYAPGGSLGSLVSRGVPVLEVSELSNWILQVCDALSYAHEECGLVHRDIKPHNIMLSGFESVKLADFGLSAQLAMSLDSESERVIGNRLTLHYASPQVIWNPYESHYLNDVYALGVTIFKLLTSTYPFKDPKADFWSWDPHNLLSMSERRKEKGLGCEPIPRRWDYAVAKCLAEDPSDRPASIREFKELLVGDSAEKAAEISLPLPSPQKGKAAKSGRLFSRLVVFVIAAAVTGLLVGILWGLFEIVNRDEAAASGSDAEIVELLE